MWLILMLMVKFIPVQLTRAFLHWMFGMLQYSCVIIGFVKYCSISRSFFCCMTLLIINHFHCFTLISYPNYFISCLLISLMIMLCLWHLFWKLQQPFSYILSHMCKVFIDEKLIWTTFDINNNVLGGKKILLKKCILRYHYWY